MNRPLLIPLALLSVALAARAGRAEESGLPPDVIEAAERGRQLFDEGRYEEAAEHLLAAYESYREPVFLQYIGRCKQELREYCQAARYYRLFLSQGEPTEEVRTQLEERLVDLDDRCEASTVVPAETPEEPPEPEETEPPRTFGQEVEPTPEEAPSTRSTDVAGGVLMGFGALAGIVGIAMWGVSWANYGDYRDAAQHDPELWNRAYGFGTAGDVLVGGVASALLTAGVIALLVGRLRARRHDRASLLPVHRADRTVMAWERRSSSRSSVFPGAPGLSLTYR